MTASIVGWAHTPFGKFDTETVESLVVRVATDALADAGISAGDVDEIVLGHFNAGFSPQDFTASLVLQADPQLRFKPATRVENACATGSAAVHQGIRAIAAGAAKIVLVVGVEQMTRTPASEIGRNLLRASYLPEDGDTPGGFAGVFGKIAQAYFQKYGDQSDALAMIAAKNHKNGVANPYAQLRKDFGYEFCRSESEKNPFVAGPLKRTDCSLVSDGAAALVLTDAETAKTMGKAVNIKATAHAQDFLPMSKRDILLFEGCTVAWQRALPCHGAAYEQQNVALRHRQEILGVRGGLDVDRLAHGFGGFRIGQHQRRRAIRHQRAIGALQRSGHKRILLAFGTAELIAEILAQLRVGIGDAVLMVLGGDHRQRVGLVAVFLEIGLRDLAEHAGKTAGGVAILRQIRRAQQVPADLRWGRPRHLLDADHQHDLRSTRRNGPDALMHRRRTGRAGVLDPCRRLEPQLRIGLQHQRCGEILRREAGVEMPEHDFIDVSSGDAGVRQRVGGNPDHQALDGLGIELAEWRMRPSDDAGCHGGSPCLTRRVCNPLIAILHAGFSNFIVRLQMAVMPAQLPDLISAAGHSQEPPTATTLGSASHEAALASPIPPVGQNRTSGKGPAKARSALIPPDCSAGKNLTRLKPWASASISSDAVAIPGANGKALAAAAFSRSGVAPGLIPNLAPIPSARARSSAFRMVPIPTTASGTSAIIAFADSIATGVRSVISSVRTPPATSALASGTASARRSMVRTGMIVACSNSAASFSCFGIAVMSRPCERVPIAAFSWPAWHSAE